jgi:uncharacterized membrane protein
MNPRIPILLSLTLAATLMLPAGLRAADADAEDGADRRAEKRAEVLEKVQTLRSVAIAERLELDEETALRVSAVLRDYDDRFMEIEEQKRDLRRDIHETLDSDELSDKEVDKLIDRLMRLETELNKLQSERIKATTDLLAPADRLRLAIMLQRFERQVRHKIMETRKKHRGPGGPGMRGDRGPPGAQLRGQGFQRRGMHRGAPGFGGSPDGEFGTGGALGPGPDHPHGRHRGDCPLHEQEL